MQTNMTREEIEQALADARSDGETLGRERERARIMRCRNACFTRRGAQTSAASMGAALMMFDGMVLRGDDPNPPGSK